MQRLDPNSRADPFGTKINRDHSAILAHSVPWLSIMLGSLAPFSPIIAPGPVLPPLGFVFLLAWCLQRPGLIPLWAGLPLGLFDDLFSGNPLGFGITLFTLTLLAIEIIHIRYPWPNFLHDWFAAAVVLTLYIVAEAVVSGREYTPLHLQVILPQLALSIILMPFIAQIISALDRLRLLRVRRIS